ncbi:MAG: dihydroorotate dehydrogenase [Clostridia bacterium]|nr:dihydroorotate dehydrogenase [Clostridia bacterium]
MIKELDLSVKIAGVEFKNPIVTASGTCGFGEEYKEFYHPSFLGAIAVKGLTPAPKAGNPPPRIAEVPSGMLNSIGLQNPGVDKFIEVELPRLKNEGATVIANIAGSTVEDYCYMAERLDVTNVDMLEMNISCPNVKEGGVAFGTDPKMVEEITSAVRAKTTKPLIVKLSPNVTDITATARAAERAGADALSLINTLLGMKIDIKTRRPILHNNVGGMSGEAVFPIAVRMVWQVRNAVSLPIIGMGGIATADQAIEMMLAGADAIAVGACMFKNPSAPVEILEGIKKYMTDNGIEKVTQITGGVIPW